MTPQEFSNILKNPDNITLSQVYELENIVHEYPYFQVARAMHLRILYTQGSYRYNKALKVTASHIADRSILFDFITSAFFKESKNPIFETKELPKTYYDEAIPKGFTQYVTEDAFTPVDTYQQSIDNEKNKISQQNKYIKESLQLGKPLDFEKTDAHSFTKWLEITRYKPIDRDQLEPKSIELPFVNEKNVFEENDARAKKFDLIDKFLEINPKIEARKEYGSVINLATEKQGNEHQLMTETLAKVYLEQGKYAEAIRAYQILILKNPEKSRFFAEQINAIKKLEQNNL